MSGASIETEPKLLPSSLRDAEARIRQLLRQARVAASAGLFLDGLLSLRIKRPLLHQQIIIFRMHDDGIGRRGLSEPIAAKPAVAQHGEH